jgi:hypothetical protein
MKLKIVQPEVDKKDEAEDTVELYLEQDSGGSVCVMSRNIRTNKYCLEVTFTPDGGIRTYHCDNPGGVVCYSPLGSNFKQGVISPF